MRYQNSLYEWIDRIDSYENRYKGPLFANNEATSVYFITDSSFVKIGVAIDINKRLRQLQTGNARKLFLLMRIDFTNGGCAYAAEADLHEIFKERRCGGEWFKLLNDDLFIHMFFQQKTENMIEDSLKFMIRKIAKRSYEDPDPWVRERIEHWKYKYLASKAPERKERQAEMEMAISLLSNRLNLGGRLNA